jgi:hypothetical protein
VCAHATTYGERAYLKVKVAAVVYIRERYQLVSRGLVHLHTYNSVRIHA